MSRPQKLIPPGDAARICDVHESQFHRIAYDRGVIPLGPEKRYWVTEVKNLRDNLLRERRYMMKLDDIPTLLTAFNPADIMEHGIELHACHTNTTHIRIGGKEGDIVVLLPAHSTYIPPMLCQDMTVQADAPGQTLYYKVVK